MQAELLSSRHEAGVTWLTIERPEKLNALNAGVLDALDAAIAKAAIDDDARVVVITGAGERAFVAGADIAELRDLASDALPDFMQSGLDLFSRIEKLGKPVIAAINGFALGGGLELALACTLRLASSTAQFGLPEIKLGLLPGYGGTQRLTRLVGQARALHMMLTGDPVKADQALAWGLVNQVTEPGELDAAVQALAGRLAASAPLAMRAIITAVNCGGNLPLDEGIALEKAQFLANFATADAREGTAAFLEKRKPEFRGQ